MLSEDDEAAIRKPLQSLFDDVKQDLNGVKSELSDVAAAADFKNGSKTAAAPVESPRPAQRYDLDAT